MENDINITKILKDKSENTMLYSSLFGNVYLYLVDTNFVIVQHYGLYIRFLPNAKYSGYDEAEAEPTLFPSKEMRDWSKFSWKRGDILVSNDGGTEVIFDKWYDDTYTSFYCKHYLNSEDENKIVYYEGFICTTERYSLQNKNSVQTYINAIEERLGGRLNRETLKIEKTMPELYDGDIAFADYGKRQDMFIVTGRTFSSDGYTSFISLDLNHMTLSLGCKTSFFKKDLCELRLATDEEKKQLFDALEKNGKRWDAKKKEVIDLKPKYEFRPFDKVLVRNYYNEVWRCDFYRTKIGDIYACIVNGNYLQCIPYNEETAKLIGTKEEYIV